MLKHRVAVLVAAAMVSGLAAGLLQAAPAGAAPNPLVFYFHGMNDDQAQKISSGVNGTPPPAGNLTFSNSDTFAATPVQQLNACPNNAVWPNMLATFWSAPFSGTIHGNMKFDMYYRATNPTAIALGLVMAVNVVADPDWSTLGSAGLIGTATPTFTFADPTPQLESFSVPVNGHVDHELLIQVGSGFTPPSPTCDTGAGLQAFYDNASYPSKFTMPEIHVSGSGTQATAHVTVNVNASGVEGYAASGTLNTYSDGRRNPPGPPAAKFTCSNGTVTSVASTNGASPGAIVQGAVTCKGFKKAKSYALTVTDKGATGDQFTMVLKDSTGKQVYTWTGTLSTGNLTVSTD